MKISLFYGLLFIPLFIPLVYLAKKYYYKRKIPLYVLLVFLLGHIFNAISYFANLGDDFGYLLYCAHYWVGGVLLVYLKCSDSDLKMLPKVIHSIIGVSVIIFLGLSGFIAALIINPPNWR